MIESPASVCDVNQSMNSANSSVSKTGTFDLGRKIDMSITPWPKEKGTGGQNHACARQRAPVHPLNDGSQLNSLCRCSLAT